MTARQIETATGYVVTMSNGRTLRVSEGGLTGYEEALLIARAEGAGEIGHDGDLTSGGDRTLCWRDAEDAHDDDGMRSLCSITARY